jgi:pectate lyase
MNLAVVNGLALSDATVQANVRLGGSGTLAELVARYGGPGDSNMDMAVLANRGGTAFAEIWQNLSGTWTELASQALTGLSPSATFTLRFDVSKTSLKLSVNGTLEASATDSTLTWGQVGIRSSAGAAIDDFSVS